MTTASVVVRRKRRPREWVIFVGLLLLWSLAAVYKELNYMSVPAAIGGLLLTYGFIAGGTLLYMYLNGDRRQ
jgi:hypothetical protein